MGHGEQGWRRWLTPGVRSALVLGAAAVAVAASPLGAGVRAALAAVVAAAAVAAALAADRARRRRVAALEAMVRGLAAGEGRALGRDAGGEFQGVRRALEDLEARTSEALSELAKKSRNLAALIDALDEPVLATDNRDAVLLCNRAAEELFGARSGGLAGRPISSLLTQEEVLAMHRAARGGEVRRGRVRMTTAAEGSRVFQVSAAPVPAASGEGVFGAVLLLRDVTDLDRAVQVKSDFVANASHELRTPVAAIRGAVDTLIEGLGDEPPIPVEMRDRLLGMVQSHAERLEEMIRDLLDLSMLESPDVRVGIEPVDLRAVEGSLRGMFEEACRAKGVELVFEVEPRAERVETDPRLLRLILRNLVENAVKFAYDGTRVVVAARPLVEREGWVRFEVRDRGIGVPLHLRERVFERYFQADSARSGPRRGTGLGLSIVKHAVRALGGEVGLESVYKEGTTVWVEAPAGTREQARSGPA